MNPFRIILTWILLLAILVGYAGIPVSKMICSIDGHVDLAVFAESDSCNHTKHEEGKNSCCEKNNAVTTPEEETGCCEFETEYYKIKEVSPLQTANKIAADPYFFYVACLLNTQVYKQPTVQTPVVNHPPPLSRTSVPSCERISVFRI